MKKTINWIQKNKNYLIGSFFVLLQIGLLYKYIFLLEFSNILWFCSHTPIIFAFAFFTKNIKIMQTLISVGLIPQIVWIIDYIGKVFFGVFIFGATDYMFLDVPLLSYLISVFEHFLSAPLVLLITYKYKPNKKILLFAFIYLLILLILSLTLTTEDYNYNLTRHILIGEEFTFPGYSYAWIFLAMIIVVIPTYYFQMFLYNLYKKKQKKQKRKNKK